MKDRPVWIKQKASVNTEYALEKMGKMLEELSLNTVCESANCPNIGKCFESKTATFMIMGSSCTRHCRFCAVGNECPAPLNNSEPENVATASERLGLKHVVITSVTRDDLIDGGADHFARTVKAIKKKNPDSTVELLIPDLQGDWDALETIAASNPEIINHNIETVPSLYKRVRPEAQYERSLDLLREVKEIDPKIFTKSGIMVGLGETREEVIQVMNDLIKVECDILTIGQYLRPSEAHIPISEYVTLQQFEEYEKIGREMGFKFVAAGPFVRSSYKALDGMEEVLKE